MLRDGCYYPHFTDDRTKFVEIQCSAWAPMAQKWRTEQLRRLLSECDLVAPRTKLHGSKAVRNGNVSHSCEQDRGYGWDNSICATAQIGHVTVWGSCSDLGILVWGHFGCRNNSSQYNKAPSCQFLFEILSAIPHPVWGLTSQRRASDKHIILSETRSHSVDCKVPSPATVWHQNYLCQDRLLL